MSEKQTTFIAALFASVFTLLIYFLNEPATIPKAKTSSEEKTESYPLPWIDPNHLLDSIRSMDTAYYFTDQVKLLKGHLFSPDDIHIFLRYDQHENKQYDRHREVYQSIKRETRMLWSDIYEAMIYGFPDTIADINGDGYKDLLQYFWPMAGCCTRECLHAYLFDPVTDTLCNVEFVNAIFFTNDKKVVSLEYGHSPDRHLMQWNGFALDTLETLDMDEMVKIRRRNGQADTIHTGDESAYFCIDYLEEYYPVVKLNTFWPIETFSPEKLEKSGKFGTAE